MDAFAEIVNQQLAAKAFSAQSIVFDDTYAGNAIVSYKRLRVREHVLQYLPQNAAMLELNSGTGDDANYFAALGHKVHATDIAEGMQQALRKKTESNNLQHLISTELCSYNELHRLRNRGPFDHVFSNFAGLNCTGNLDQVLLSLQELLNPGGVVTLVLLPKFCLWESLLLFKGRFKTATRRWFSKKGVTAHVEGTYFKCWYYDPSYIIKTLANSFDLLAVEGLCTIVPPSYIEGFAEKYPKLYNGLTKIENRFKCCWPWRFIGDYYIISLGKKAVT